MTKEDDYKIATIVCASVAGALLILLLLTWLCCCLSYERKRRPHVVNRKARTSREVVRWEVSPYEGWGQDVQQVQVAQSGCGCGGPAAPSGGCRSCGDGGYNSSAYNWMAPAGGVLNTYAPTPVKSSGEYGKVLLNTPKAVCAKPNITSTQLAGHINPNPGAGCSNMTASASSAGFVSCPNAASTGAQFVLESANSRY